MGGVFHDRRSHPLRRRQGRARPPFAHEKATACCAAAGRGKGRHRVAAILEPADLVSDSFSFRLLATDGAARRGEIATPHGSVATPAFMPVGTQATVKGLAPEAVRATRRRHRACQYLSPDAAARRRAHRGARRVAHVHELAASDPHRFRRLPGHVALAAAQGRRTRASPSAPISTARWSSSRPSARSRSRACSAPTSPCSSTNASSCRRRAASSSAPCGCRCAWAERSKRAFESAPPGRALFGIVQGGDDPQLRLESARALVDIGFPGYAIGGLAVGEPQEVMLRTIEEVAPALPPIVRATSWASARRRT